MNKKDQVEEGNYNLLKIAHWNLEVLLLLGDTDCVNHVLPFENLQKNNMS